MKNFRYVRFFHGFVFRHFFADHFCKALQWRDWNYCLCKKFGLLLFLFSSMDIKKTIIYRSNAIMTCSYWHVHEFFAKWKTPKKPHKVHGKFNPLKAEWRSTNSRDGYRTAVTSKMELFVITVNGFQPLPIITKCSILDVATVLDPPLDSSWLKRY